MTDLDIWYAAYLAALAGGLEDPWQVANAALYMYRDKEEELDNE